MRKGRECTVCGLFSSTLTSTTPVRVRRHLSWVQAGINCSPPVCVQLFRLFVAPQTVSRQAPLSTGFSRQEYWSGLPFPSPGDLTHPRIKPMSPILQADSLPLSLLGIPQPSSGAQYGLYHAQEEKKYTRIRPIVNEG